MEALTVALACVISIGAQALGSEAVVATPRHWMARTSYVRTVAWHVVPAGAPHEHDVQARVSVALSWNVRACGYAAGHVHCPARAMHRLRSPGACEPGAQTRPAPHEAECIARVVAQRRTDDDHRASAMADVATGSHVPPAAVDGVST